MTITSLDVTEEKIAALRTEAAEAGDLAMVQALRLGCYERGLLPRRPGGPARRGGPGVAMNIKLELEDGRAMRSALATLVELARRAKLVRQQRARQQGRGVGADCSRCREGDPAGGGDATIEIRKKCSK